MKLLIDMNLPPQLVEPLAEAVQVAMPSLQRKGTPAARGRKTEAVARLADRGKAFRLVGYGS